MIKVRCPICERMMQGHSEREWPQFPFCSPKCKLVDLGRWLGENYRVVAAPDDEEVAPDAGAPDPEPP
jgi:endogenous inhibitor of DNA gyrase (YacG/DUF329 family)